MSGGADRDPAIRFARGALLLLAFALPFSIAIVEGALVTGLLALLAARARGRAFTWPRTWLDPAALALVASWLVASAFSPEPVASLVNARKLYALGLVVLAAEGARDPWTRRRLVPALLAGAMLTAIAGFVIFAIKVQADPGYRLQSLLSNQMTSGGVLAAAGLWGLGLLAERRAAARVIAGVWLLPILAALVLTQTRGHWLGFAAGALVLALARAPRLAFALPAAAGLAAWLAPRRLLARLASVVDPNEPGNLGRLSMWRSGWEIFRERPLTGAGCQDLLALYLQHRRPDATFESGHFHNNLVQFAVMAGVPGLLAFVFWSVAGFRVLLAAVRARTPEPGLAASALGVFVAMQVGGLTDFTFGDAEVVYQSYLALGVALALLPARDPLKPRR